MHVLRLSLAFAVLVGAGRNSLAELNFNLNNGAGLTALQTNDLNLYNQVRNGFTSAAAIWSNRLSDNVTININIDFVSLGSGVLGQAGSSTGVISYSNFRNGLIADATSATDVQAVNSLPAGSFFPMRTNDRLGNVVVNAIPTISNQTLEITTANAKALGFLPGDNAAVDASISFSSDFSFDFDRSNGIAFNAFDFIGVAAHEIGHALGFISGVDTVDFFSGSGAGSNIDIDPSTAGTESLDDYAIFNSLDLFRYSTASIALAPGTLDGATGGTPYFSLDSGVTSLGLFSTGSANGDGRQASHWKDNLGLGILDPTSSNGELLAISNLDMLALDAIGWDINVSPVPEPTTLSLLLVGMVLLQRSRQKRRKSC